MIGLALIVPLAAQAQQLSQGPQGPQGRGGRGAANQEPPKNLQVLPKDSTRQQVLQAMQAFTQGLGVGCEHCHAEEIGGQQDFAADTKPEKQTARAMMRLTADLNQRLAPEIGKPLAETTQVQCVTCHRGVPVPRQLADIIVEVVNAKGTSAALDRWRELRKQFYGAQAYDFSERGLAPAAQRLTAANRPDDALALLQANLEFYPQSASTYALMAQAYQRKNDRGSAIKSLEKALELDPKNQQARRQLEQLKQQP